MSENINTSQEIDLHRFYTSFPNSVFELRLKPIYIAKYLDYYQKNYEFTLSDWRVFEEKGLAEKYTYSEEEILRIIKTKCPQKLVNSNKICDWCFCSTYSLHKHHYPKKKCDGGKDIVQICPNCHYEYHHLEKVRYRIKPQYDVEVVL